MIKMNLIIMAAGSSRRFGSNKLLYPIQGRPMFQFVFDQVEKAAKILSQEMVCRVFVVTRFEEIIQETKKRGFIEVFSPESVNGASFTVKNAIRAAGSDSDYYMFLTADQPCLQASSIVRLVRDTRRSGKGIGSMCWQEELGNPVLFHRNYLNELSLLEGDTGGRSVMKKHRTDCYLCEAARKEELMDADTPKTAQIILAYTENM